MVGRLTRRAVVQGAGAVALLTATRTLARTESAWSGYERALVIDGLGSPYLDDSELTAPLPAERIAELSASGLAGVHLTIEPVGTTPADRAFVQAVEGIGYWEREIDRHPRALARVREAADLVAAKTASRTGLVYGFQDGVAFETELSRLETFHRMGIRVIQPTYNRRNLLGDGCLEPANAGLSAAGLEAIERMNALGILIDLSHCGRRTAGDAIRASRKPVAFTHTGCAAVLDHPRHRTDEELRAVADQGGVTGIYFMPYLTGGRQPVAADIARHLEHAIQMAGEDHVSIGTDGSVSAVTLTAEYRSRFAELQRARRESGIAAPGETEDGYLFASDLNTPRRLDLLAALLERRGHGAARIEKILGHNLLRVFRDTW